MSRGRDRSRERGRSTISDALDLSAAPGLVALWRADLGVTAPSNALTGWGDQNGSGHHLTQSDPAQQAVWGASAGPNGLPGITFSSNRNVRTPLTVALSPSRITIYTALKLNALNGFQSPVNTSDAPSWNRGYGLVKRVATGVYRLGGWVNRYDTAGADIDLVQNEWTLIAMRFDGVNVSVWKNGGSPVETPYSTAITHGSGPFAVGASFVSTGVYAYGAEATMLDLAVCGQAHDNATVAKVFKKLSQRTGVAVT